MSFGLSTGGGQVRYAVIFDSTQAERNVKTYQSSLQQLASGSTNVSGKMAIMNNTFSAGVTPIKNTGNALNQLATAQTSIGSKLGGIASGFKSNALAIGAAASSVLGLYQNYANLSSAQNNANKSATAAKAAQNNLTKAQDNLNKAIDKYGAGSKEAKAAQDKLTVAQERAVNKTESAKIAQDNLNQTMADFGINILPNVILAGGSITSIFDNIGKSGSGVTGIFSKLGGSIKTSVIPAISGLAGTGGIGGLIDKFKGLGTSASGTIPNMSKLGSAFSGVGKSGTGVAGIVTSLGGALVGFNKSGTSTSGILTTLGKDVVTTGGGFKGFIDKIKGLGGLLTGTGAGIESIGKSAVGAETGLNNMSKGAAGAKLSIQGLGLAIASATIVITTIVTELEVLKRTMDFAEQAKKTDDITKKFDLWHKAIGNMAHDPDILHQILIAVSGTSGELDIASKAAGFFADQAKNVALQTKNAVKPSQELQTAMDKLNIAAKDPALRSHVTATADAAKATLKHAQAEVDRLTALDKTNAALAKNNTTLGKSNTLSQEELNILGRAKEAKQQQLDWQVQLSANYELVMEKTKAAADNAAREALSIKLEDDAMKNILPNIVKMGEAHATAADQIKLVGDMVKLTKDKMVEWDAAVQGSNAVELENDAMKNILPTLQRYTEGHAASTKTVKEVADMVKLSKDRINEWNPAAQKGVEIMSVIDDVLAGLPAKQATWTNAIEKSTQAEEISNEVNKAIEGFQKDQESGYKLIEAAILGVAYAHNVNTKAMEDMVKNGVDEVVQLRTLVAESINYTAALDDMKANQELISEGFLSGITAAEGFFNDLVKGTEHENVFNASLAKGAYQLGINSEMLAFSSGKMQDLIKTTYAMGQAVSDLSVAAATDTSFLKDNVLIQAVLKDAMIKGAQSANDWTISMISSTQAAKDEHGQLLNLAATMLNIPVNASLSTDELHKLMQSFQDSGNAAQAMAEVMTAKLAPAFETIQGLLSSKNGKDFSSAFKDLELPKGFGKGFRDALQGMAKDAKTAREGVTAFDIVVDTAGQHIDHSAKEFKKFGEAMDKLTKMKGTTSAVDSLIKSLKTMSPEEMSKHTESMHFLEDQLNQFGRLRDPGKFIKMFNDESKDISPSVDPGTESTNKLGAAFTAMGLTGVAARAQVDMVTGAVDVMKSHFAETKPVINIDISAATKLITRLIGNFNGYVSRVEKANPAAKINIGPATKLITRLIGNFNGYVSRVEKANPAVKINIGPAVKSIDRLIGDLNGIPNITRTVTIKTKTVGGGTASGSKADTSNFSKGDTSGLFVGGSKSDSGSGDTIINVHVMDETIMRRITARSGRGRFTMGA